MSDFSELCPLFETGVFNEITFSHLALSAISASGNALYGSLFPSTSMEGKFTFGRTVVVTNAFIKRYTANAAVNYLHLKHFTSASAAGTIFGTVSVTPTVSILDLYAWKAFETITDKTFTSSDILGLSPATGTAASAGTYALIVRYRDK